MGGSKSLRVALFQQQQACGNLVIRGKTRFEQDT